MTRPYSVDLRERMVRAVEAGASRRATAAKFEVSPSCVVKLVPRWHQRGTLEPDPAGQARRPRRAGPRTAGGHAGQHDRRTENPARDRRHRGQPVGNQPFPHRLWADAKKKTAHAAEQDRPDVAAARRVWRAQQPALSPQRMVFIDETWAATAMTRRYGRARRGRPVVAAVPHGHWKTTTFIAGCATTG
jgi:transposase-like protein